MELWIRSQDKWTLTTAKSVYVRFPDEKRASIFNQDNINIGQYSWERALEILNEIQKILMPKTILNFDDIVRQDDVKRFKEAFYENEPIILNKATIEHLDTYVYEMPEV